MKRPRSHGEDAEDEWDRRDHDLDRPLPHRRFYTKVDTGRRGTYEDDRDVSRSSRKRLEHESEGFEPRKAFDRYRDRSDRLVSASTPRGSYSVERIHRSESFSTSRRDFDVGYWSERDRLRREESVSAWRRSVIGKDSDEDKRGLANTFVRGNRSGSEEKAGRRSPTVFKDVAKSPQWAADSGSERSKSAELKKSVEGCSKSSEMEEGELKPDSDPELELEMELKEPGGEDKPGCLSVLETDLGVEMKTSAEEQLGVMENGSMEMEDRSVENEPVSPIENEMLNHRDGDAAVQLNPEEKLEVSVKEEKEENAGEEWNSSSSPDDETESDKGLEEDNEKMGIEKQSTSEVRIGDQNSVDIKLSVEEHEINETDEKVNHNDKNHKTPIATLKFLPDNLNEGCKDKGKGVALDFFNDGDSSDDCGWRERDLLTGTGKEIELEGPSYRGFQLFLHTDSKRTEKTNQPVANLNEDTPSTLVPLELSLGLPNFLSAVDSQDKNHAFKSQSSPSHGRSAHSLPAKYLSGSEGFTASISISGSHPYSHNPSCSLTQNSFENYEHSVGSHPIFNGIDQGQQGSIGQGQSSNERKHKDAALFQGILQCGNASLNGTHASLNLSAQRHRHHKSSGTANHAPNHIGMDQQLNLPRQMSGQLRQDGLLSPCQSLGSRETRSDHIIDKKVFRESTSSLSSVQELGHLFNSTDAAVRIVARVVSEPIKTMAKKIQEMEEQYTPFLKESVSEMIDKEEKRVQLGAFQKLLQRRSDITREALESCHRTQLEIFVALKTGIRDFLWQKDAIPSSELVNIFLNLKCRNLSCQSILPVDDCECKICARKDGFCSACMCLVCMKFDTACNTCSWVGCDVCLHWCHTDCGLRNCHIRNGPSTSVAHGQTEMQFHCIACGHPSEMFGFVKEVFKACASNWNAETLGKELKYVKRIFCASDDVRGKQMHDVASQMLEKLDSGSNVSEVHGSMIAFLDDGDLEFGNNSSSSLKDLNLKLGEGTSGVNCKTPNANWLRPVSSDKVPLIENKSATLPSLGWEEIAKREDAKELQVYPEKQPQVDELERIVLTKQAEAKMFQTRADDARKDAEGLKQIIVAKSEKIDRDYANRIAKLRMSEAKEIRRQRLEEFHALEKAHQEYMNMKMRMESDIKDLLLKVEAMKPNLGS